MHAGPQSKQELCSYLARAKALELQNVMQIRGMENEVCVGEQYDAARTLRLRDLFATARTRLLTRSFHLETLLWSSVLPPMGSGEWIHRIGRATKPLRARYRLAEADR
jgi:hypothetical protein